MAMHAVIPALRGTDRRTHSSESSSDTEQVDIVPQKPEKTPDNSREIQLVKKKKPNTCL